MAIIPTAIYTTRCAAACGVWFPAIMSSGDSVSVYSTSCGTLIAVVSAMTVIGCVKLVTGIAKVE